MTSLSTYIASESQKPADLVAVLAKVAGLKDVIGEREQQVRDRLEEQVRELAEAAGGQFTVRADAGTAYLAGGNPKPQVTDREEFASWYADEVGGGQLVERVEVIDHAEAAGCIAYLSKQWDEADPQGEDVTVHADTLAVLLREALKVVAEYVLPDGALDGLVESGRAVAQDEVLVDTQTGEAVPGVTVRYSRESLTVKPSKEWRNRTAAEIRGDLPELEGEASDG